MMNIITEAYAMGPAPQAGGQSSGVAEVISSLLPFIIFIIFAGLIVLITFGRRKKAAIKTKEIDKQIQDLRRRILVVTSSTIPGKEIKDVIGSVAGVSKVEASTDVEFRLAEKEALLDIMNQAINLGANAIIDLKMTTGSYQQQGSQWMVSKVTYSGTAVRI